MPRKPFDPNDASDSDHVRAKTVVTAISRISERPNGKQACLVIIYGDELGKKYNLDTNSVVVGRSSKCDIQIDQDKDLIEPIGGLAAESVYGRSGRAQPGEGGAVEETGVP